MRGRIYSDQKCPVCGGSFFYDGRTRGLYCPRHPDQKATGRFRVHFGRSTKKRFSHFVEAERFLTGLRFHVDQGTYDPRDYRANYPLGFETLAEKWLEVKKKEVKSRSYSNLQNYMNKAIEAWGQKNIKVIGYGEIEDFLHSHKLSDKTKSNIKSCLHSFFVWIKKREKIPVPDFPEISYELGWRQTIDKSTQDAIINEVRRISYHTNPKIWIGIKMLATYISVRPKELISIKEKEIELESGYLFIPHPKEKKAKAVPLIDEDIDLLKQFPKGFPELCFFRHPEGISGCRPGQPFGQKYFYKWWKKACSNLNVDGVDLYGGTRHSTALALRELASPEQIKRSMMTSTNKAFERYFRVESDEVRSIYELTRENTKNNRAITDSIGRRK